MTWTTLSIDDIDDHLPAPTNTMAINIVDDGHHHHQEKAHNAPTLSRTIWTAEGEIHPCLMGRLTHSPDSVGYHLTRHS